MISVITQLLIKARKSSNPIFINTVMKLNNCRWARELNGDISIQDIFIEQFDNFIKDNSKLKIRNAVIDNIEKMRKFRLRIFFLRMS